VKTWLPWALLAVSLILNIFLIAGFFWTSSAIAMWRDPEARFEMLADRLDLSEPQRTQFREAVGALKDKGFGQHREERWQMRQEILDMALQPNPDRAAIMARIEEATRARVQSMGEALDIMLPFLASLTPEQRTELKELMAERRDMWRNRWGGGHWGWGGHHMGWAN
jgi:Spy/CpxP family protein refolding chaperone